jgi:hypothetical protein
MIFQKILSVTKSAQKQQEKRTEEYRKLIRREAAIGGTLFGPIPSGHRREFFCLDERTWIWHEEWNDVTGAYHHKTTRYDVRPDGILKAQDGQAYQKVSLEEANNLLAAAELYKERVVSDMYQVSA